MSYLIANGIPDDSTKAIISIWFRIPSESYEKAQGKTSSINVPVDAPGSYFFGVVPIITFGPNNLRGGRPNQELSSSWIGAVYNQAFRQDGSYNLSGAQWGGGGFGLGFNLQFTSTGSINDIDSTRMPENICLGVTHTGGGDYVCPTIIPLNPDVWHHLLLSWDIRGMSTRPSIPSAVAPRPLAGGVSGGAKIYIALDDNNLKDTSPEGDIFWPCGGYGGSDGNTWITPGAYNVAGEDVENDPPEEPHFSWDGEPVPMSEHLFGLPSAGIVDHNYRVELAEFMLWIDKTLNTDDIANRRAFISANGTPVPPDQTKSMDSAGNVVKTSGSIELFGQPDIMLHGSSNWKKGLNNGTTGEKIAIVAGEKQSIIRPEGQFTPTGGINAWKPDPSL